MEKYTITISDPALVAGITAAREAYNESLDGNQTPLKTNGEYVQFVMERAAQSYANQYETV